jgi:hypothetical protein
MKPNNPALTILIFLAISAVFYWFTKPILAVEYQNCSTSTNCVIGEFLYDDTYTPDATASCTLSSRYPNGNAFINPPAAMTASSSGWYSYSATIGTTEGIYPSQICCTTFNNERLCLDKTFKVVSPAVSGATASEVWNYTDRSLTSFGTLIADIWGYSTRSLTGFGTLVADIWSRDSRTLTGTDSAMLISTSADIKEIKRVNQENRVLLERLINKPVVKTFIDDSTPPKLSDKINQTKSAATNLYSIVQNLRSRSLILAEKWPTLSENEIKSELSTLLFILKQDTAQKDSNILSTTNWLKTVWNSPILLNLSDQAQAAQSQIENLLNDLALYEKGESSESFSPAISHIEKLHGLVGSSLSTSTDLNLFGFIKKTTDQAARFDQQTAEGLRLLTEIKKDSSQAQPSVISQFTGDVLATNLLPQVESFFEKSIKDTGTLSNKLLGLLAIIDSNKLLLASNTGQTVKIIWLEEGSIIFRAVASNPSRSIAQTVILKYYLPSELKKEQIISHDPQLTIEYDPVENALFASGEIVLDPLETRTFSVESEDIWNFKQEEIDSLKNQVNELTQALKNTNAFAQATAIKSDIIVSLNKILLRQEQAVTPENRIQVYRESSLEMNGIEDKIISLKELLIQTGNVRGPFGLPGSIQPITLWGIVLIIIAGFAFLSMYFNALRTESQLKKAAQKDETKNPLDEYNSIYHPSPIKYHHRETHHPKARRAARIISIALLTAGISSLGASASIKASRVNSVALISPIPDATVLGTTSETKYPYETKLQFPDSNKIPVRSAPSITSSEIMSLKDVKTVYVYKIVDDWAQIGLFDKDVDKNWWLNTQYIVLK